MTPFPSRLRAALSALAFTLALPALAQEAPPGAPRSILPPALAEDAASPADSGSRPLVETGSLTQGSAVRLGILDAGSGGFDDTLWRDTPPATVTTLLPNLPIAQGSPALHDLNRRLLLSAAPLTPQAGDAERTVIAARLRLLAARGDLGGLTALAGRVGRELEDDEMVRLKTTALLLGEDFEEACITASDQVGRTADAEWLKLLAFCRALSGDRAGAALAIELLQETAVDDPTFYQLLNARLQPSDALVKLKSLRSASPLVLAMALEQGAALPEDTLDDAAPLVLAKLAATPALAIEKRLQAARAVAELGGMPADRLREIYAAAPFSKLDRIGAALIAAELPPALADALLYQGIVAANNGAERARMVQAASLLAASQRALPALAYLVADAVAEIAPTPETLPAAADITRLLLLAGRSQEAALWYAALRATASGGDGKATATLIDLWPLAIVGAAADAASFSPEILDLWRQNRQALDEDARRQQELTLFTLLEALGYAVPEIAWAGLSGDAAARAEAPPSDPIWTGMIEAAAGGRVGETVLSAAIVCAKGGPAATPPLLMASVVRALKDVGLEADARRLAIEALVARGF
ncbi:MAG: hypothetical protein H3C28_00930 [Sphingomonadales bacterium]|nr:hypothetical protein [Sphingomonadales bacterium]